MRMCNVCWPLTMCRAGSWTRRWRFAKRRTPSRLFPQVIGMLAGLLKRTGDTRRSEELLRKLQPGDAYGAPRGLAVYHWVLREFEAEADWLEKAIDQRDYAAVYYLRVGFARELRLTPRWAGLMRKLNLPETVRLP